MSDVVVPKGYKKTKVGVIPEEWEVVKLGEIFEKSFYGTSKPTFNKGKYPVLRMGNMQQGSLIYDNLVYINLDDNEFQKLQLKQGDILLNRTNSYELVGKISLFDHKDSFVTASYIVTYRPNKEKVCSIFINNLLNTNYFQDRIKAIATKGVSQANINPTSFKNVIKIPLPPLKEQEKIAQILTTWDEAISKQEKLIEAKERLKKGLMQKLLSGDVRFKEFDEEWKETKLGRYIKEVTKKNKNNKTFLVLTVSTKEGFISQEEYFDRKVASKNTSNYKIINKGHFAYNPSRVNIGSISYLDTYEKGILSPMYIVFKCINNLDDIYFKYWLNTHSFQGNLYKFLSGSVRDSLSFKDMKLMKIKLPPLKEQQKIAKALSIADKEIELLKKELESLKKQKKGLMQRLLSGKIRTNNTKERE